MNDALLEELFKKGLITEERYMKTKAEKELVKDKGGENKSLRKISSFDLNELDSVGSVRNFKEKAKEILLEDSSLIQEILKKAHRLEQRDGGRKLIWLLYQLRDALKQASSECQELIIKGAFRKAGAKI